MSLSSLSILLDGVQAGAELLRVAVAYHGPSAARQDAHALFEVVDRPEDRCCRRCGDLGGRRVIALWCHERPQVEAEAEPPLGGAAVADALRDDVVNEVEGAPHLGIQGEPSAREPGLG